MSTPPPKNKNIFSIGLLSFFGGVSQDIFTPILPVYYTTVLGFDKAFVGVAEGVVTASSYIFTVISGFLSDKFKKRKPLIFIGYLFSLVSRPFLAFLTSAPAVIGLRLADGMGKGIKDPPKDVLIAGSADERVRGRGFGIARMLDTFGSVAGPLILFGLLYALKGSATLYRDILLFTAAPLLVALLILVFRVKEVPNPSAGVAVRENAAPVKRIPLPKSFYIFLAIVIFFTLGNASDAFLILRAKNVGITLLELPLVIALFNFIYALFAVPFGTLSDKIGRIPTILIGWAAYALVHLGFALTSHALAIWFLYGFYGIYYATSQGVVKAFLADTVEPAHRGKAFGVYGTTVGLATLPASFFAGFLWDSVSPAAPFYFGAAVAAAAALLLLVIRKRVFGVR